MKKGDRVYFYPRVQGRMWEEHPHYGEQVVIEDTAVLYPLYYIRFSDGSDWWANDYEISEVKR